MTEQELGEWTGSLADLDGPPDGIEDIRVGDRIELIEDGELRGVLAVLSVWNREEATT